MNGTIYVQFPAGATHPTITVGAGAGAFGIEDPWRAAATDAEWQAEQKAFLDLAAAADREAISSLDE